MTTDLLTLISTVDPNDIAACGELNARFSCFLKKVCADEIWNYSLGSRPAWRDEYFGHVSYTTSLDALKAVQNEYLEGWEITVHQHCQDDFTVFLDNDKWQTATNSLPTMQLAWMDAIYQAITWKRENDD